MHAQEDDDVIEMAAAGTKALVAMIRTSRPALAVVPTEQAAGPAPQAEQAAETPSPLPTMATPPVSEPVEPAPSARLRIVKKDRFEPPASLERGEKICIDCGLPYPLAAFYTSTSSRDGRQSRCKECDNKRRTEHNQGLHMRPEVQQASEQKVARKLAMTSSPTAGKPYSYEGVRGGFLIYGYVK